MNKEDLRSYIKNGVSLNNELKKVNFKDGFIVSLLGYEKIFTSDQEEEIEKQVIEYSKRINKNEVVGIWQNNGLVYVDISTRYENKRNAKETGIKNKQLAIYDVKNKKDIPLLQTTYILYRYNKIKNDITYIKEFYNIKDLEKDFQMKYSSLKHYIYKNIENEIQHLLQDKFVIIKDSCYIDEIEF